MIKSVSKNKGGILMEAMVAMAIFAIGMSFVLLLFVSSSKGALYSLEGTKASLMETQSMEAVRSILNDRGWLPTGTYEVGLKDNKEWDIISTDGLVGHWKLSGDTNDYSGNGNHGTLVGGVTWAEDRMGQARGSAEFDGVDDYVDAGNDASLDVGDGDFTVSFWFDTTKMDGNIISDKYDDSISSAGWCIYPDSPLKRIRVRVSDGSNQVAFSGLTENLVDGSWYHGVVLRSGDNLTVYVNGVYDGSISGVESYNLNNNQNIFIGKQGDDNSNRFFDGLIDDVRIYNRALSEDEIKALYGHYSEKYQPKVTVGDGITDGLVGYWPMNEGEGSYIYDYSPRTDNWGKMFGPYLNFDGTNDYVDAGNNESIKIGNNSMSICAWFNLNDFEPSKEYVLVSKYGMGYGSGGSNALYYLLINDSGYPIIVIRDDNDNTTQSLISSYSIGSNSWNFVCGGRNVDEQKIEISVNGSEIESILSTENGNLSSWGLSPLLIGAKQKYSDSEKERFFNGSMDDVRIYNRALSPEEVSKLYKGEWVSDTGLVGHWDMNEGYGGQVSDKSGNGNHGTINGATWGDNSPEWVDDVSGGALDFDGNNDYVNVGNISSFDFSESFTIGVWVNLNKFGDARSNCENKRANIVSAGANPSGVLELGTISGDRFWANIKTETWLEISTPGIVNQWVYLNLINDRSINQFRMVINGETKTQGSYTSLTSNQGIVRIGGTTPNCSYGYTDGLIDDVRIYNRALSEAEIQKIYEYGRTNKFYTSE